MAMSKPDIFGLTLIAVAGIVLAALLNGGIYQMVAVGAGSGGSQDATGNTEIWAYRINRFTGNVTVFYGFKSFNPKPPPY
jgi:hypothetical protein